MQVPHPLEELRSEIGLTVQSIIVDSNDCATVLIDEIVNPMAVGRIRPDIPGYVRPGLHRDVMKRVTRAIAKHSGQYIIQRQPPRLRLDIRSARSGQPVHLNAKDHNAPGDTYQSNECS